MVDEKKRILDSTTLVPLGILVTVAGGLLGGAVWLNTKFLELDFRLQSIERKVADPWNIDKMRAWRDLAEKGNPSMWWPPINKD
jgi:hypothetical protein